MRNNITIKGDGIQYGDLGQLHLSDVIIHLDDMSVRADTAIAYMRHGMGHCFNCEICEANKEN